MFYKNPLTMFEVCAESQFSLGTGSGFSALTRDRSFDEKENTSEYPTVMKLPIIFFKISIYIFMKDN